MTPNLNAYPREMKSYVHKKYEHKCSQHYSQYPKVDTNQASSTEKWINKMWYIHNGVVFNHKKKLLIHTTTNIDED
jgi:hypothetical protein